MASRAPLLCTRCGWAEAAPSAAASAGRDALRATKFAVRTGGRLGSTFGSVVKGVGIALIIVGIPFLLIGVGAIMIGMGIVLCLISTFLKKGGQLVAESGSSTAKSCPSCGAPDLIPMDSPVGQRFMADHGLSSTSKATQ